MTRWYFAVSLLRLILVSVIIRHNITITRNVYGRALCDVVRLSSLAVVACMRLFRVLLTGSINDMVIIPTKVAHFLPGGGSRTSPRSAICTDMTEYSVEGVSLDRSFGWEALGEFCVRCIAVDRSIARFRSRRETRDDSLYAY